MSVQLFCGVRKFLFRLSLFVISIIASDVASHAFPSDPRYLYLGVSNLSQLTANDLSRLQTLRSNGLNIIILPIGTQPLATTAGYIRANPVLSQFKYVISFGWLIDNQCLYNGSCVNLAKSGFRNQLQQNISEPIAVAKANPDLFVGYYLYDEPMAWRVPAYAQEFTYNFLRSLDPDIVNRPAISAHANWIVDTDPKDPENKFLRVPDDKEILTYMSPYAQDVVLSSQYAWDVETQQSWFSALNRLGFFVKPFVQIIPSFSEDFAGCNYRNLVRFTRTIRTALKEVGQLSKLSGFGYFSFWKSARNADFMYDIENCVPIVDATLEHLQSEAAVVDSRFAPESASWMNEFSQPLILNDRSNETNRGSISKVQNIALSGGGFVGSGVRLVPPSTPSGMVKGFFPAINLSAIATSYFVTQVGLDAAQECGTGVGVSLLVTNLSNNSQWSVPHVIELPRGKGKVPFIVDLSPWNGSRVALGLLMSSKGDASCDHVIVERPRLITLGPRANPYSQIVTNDQSILHPFTAQWTNDQMQPVSFGVNFPPNPEIGFGLPDSYLPISGATIQRGGLEIPTGFIMHPPYRPYAHTKAVFTPRLVSQVGKSFLVAQVGLGYNPECGDGVTVDAITKDLVTGYKKVVSRINVNRFSGIQVFYGDLESTRGHQTEFQFMVKSNTNPNCDHLMIGNPRIIRFNE